MDNLYFNSDNQKEILQGSIILSKEWRAYSFLKIENMIIEQ